MYRRSFLTSIAAAALSTSVFCCSTQMQPRPNILLAIADDATWLHMGAYFNDWVKTPAFDRVAREGILFTRCYTLNAKCALARASILTGRNAWQLEEAANHWCFFPNKFKTYAEVLKENSYHVGYVAKGWAPSVVGEVNGIPFPRAKGQAYEYANHLPLAIMWQDGIKNPGRVVDDFVSFIDFAPTFLAVAAVNAESSDMQAITGTSLTGIFASAQSGQVESVGDHVLIGKERHDIGRPHDWGYPIRGIRKGDWLYIHNFETERWPGGNPETGYLNCDGSPTKTEVLASRKNPATETYWQLNFDKRPEEELYNVRKDPECLTNHVEHADFIGLYADENFRHFYEKYTSGQKLHAGWVNESDFEPNFPE